MEFDARSHSTPSSGHQQNRNKLESRYANIEYSVEESDYLDPDHLHESNDSSGFYDLVSI